MKNKKVPKDNSGTIKTNLRRFIIVGTIVYTILVLYFMFLGFNRTDARINYSEYTFILIPEVIPLRFPELTMSWLYDFGNIAAFIPFGIIVPWLYRIRFRKFISLFVLMISALEVLQSLTFMGTFDIADIISNTLGAIIGFIAFKVGFSTSITFRKLVASAVSILISIILIIVVSETINFGVHVNETIGQVQSITEISKTAPETEPLSSFMVQGENANPTLNLYSSRDGISKEYLFRVDRENPWIYATCGIPDGEEYKGSVTILVNGEELFQFSGKDEDRNIHKMKTFYNAELKEMKIIVTGNAKVWDVGIAKIRHWWE